MSKSILSVLEVGAIIGLQFIPGVGQAVSGLLAGVGIAGVSASTGLLLATTALGLAEAGLNAALAPGAPKPEQTETSIKVPTPPRVTAYGPNRLHMAFALYTTAKDGTAADVGVFNDGRVGAITGYYLGDTKVRINANGFVLLGDNGQFGPDQDNVQISTRIGQPTEVAFSAVIAKLPDQWTTNHRGDGCVTGAVLSKSVKSKNYATIYPNGGPNQNPLSLVITGTCVYDWRDPSQSQSDPSTWKASANPIVQLADYETRFDAKDWSTHIAPTLDYWTAAANDCDSAQALASVQTIIVEKADHGSGHITVSSANGLATGDTINISATGNTDQTETRTVTSLSGGNGGTVVGLSSALKYDHPQGSAVTYSSATASEPRYQSVVAFKHTDPRKGVVANLLSTCDGWLSPRSDGALVVYSGRYMPPTVTIGPDEIVSYSLQEGVDEENAVNFITLTYVSANHDYNTVDTDAWTDDDDISARSKVLSDSLADQIPSASQARRLGKRKMAKAMAPMRGTVTTNSRGRIVRGERYIWLTITEAGTTFLDAPVEITKLTRNLQTGGVTFEWLLADPNIDAWNPATEEGNPAPIGNPVAGAPLDAPVITAAVRDSSAVSGDGNGVRVAITASGPNRSDLTWTARFRLVGAATWNEQQYTDTAAGSTVQLETAFVPVNGSVEVEVAYQTGDGRVSLFSDAFVVDTTAAPSGSAYRFLSQSAVPLSSDDTSIMIAAFDGVLDRQLYGGTMLSLPSGSVSDLDSGKRYAVFINVSGGQNATHPYFAVVEPALDAFASPYNVFVGWQSTSFNGSYATTTDSGSSAGYGGDGSTPRQQAQQTPSSGGVQQ